MRIFLLFGIIISGLSGCKTVSYFNTPNDVFKEQGIIYLTDGSERKGALTIQLETGRDAKGYINLTDEKREHKIRIDSILCYKTGGHSYYLKKLDVLLNDNLQLLFVKRLTSDSSRVHLYELHQQRSQSADGREYYYYFISFPGYDRLNAQNVAGKNFLPKFNEKVSMMFTDCMNVATRIRNEERGYFLPLYTLSNQKKVKVWKNIIEAYNQCK